MPIRNKVRYQVFVSSTYEDLIEPRRAVLDALHSAGYIPAGMEAFPAANPGAWKVITNVIDDSDLYVLIIAGRYGSIDQETQVSFTEREYQYAAEAGKPVIAFIHSDPDGLSHRSVEKNEAGIEKLRKFVKHVTSRHTVRFWKGTEDLVSSVIVALANAIQSEDGLVGWVRADGIDNQDLYKKITDLQERHDALTVAYNELKEAMSEDIVIPGAAGLDESTDVEVEKRIEEKGDKYEPAGTERVTWRQLFGLVAKACTYRCREWEVYRLISDGLALPDSHRMKNAETERIRYQLEAIGLITTFLEDYDGSGMFRRGSNVIWQLSDKGKYIYLESVIAKADSSAG